MMRNKLILWSLLLGMSVAVQAQVTIGSSETTEKAAILDLKSQASDAQNITTGTGGILLPRVALKDLNTLEPFISLTSAEWMDATKREALKKEHTGLEVYNLTANAAFKAGAYVWDGGKWDVLFKEIAPIVPIRIAFPLPAFNLPLVDDTDSDTFTVDLYNIYTLNLRVNNFHSNMEETAKVEMLSQYRYALADLDFVVTHYDKSVITINGISDAGIMSYTVHNVNPRRTSFMNIYAVVKKGHERK